MPAAPPPARSRDAPIAELRAAAFTIPTDAPEADGTFSWDATTMVVVQVDAAGERGLGYTYVDAAAVAVVQCALAHALRERDAFDVPGCRLAMQRAVRNTGRGGLAACAISAVDAALWDWKARALGVPLATLLGRCRDTVPVYGSGGFTSYDDGRLADQLARWVREDGCRFVKMKVGTHPDADPRRIEAARRAIGEAQLFIDANGALSARGALRLAHLARDQGLRWFEEPVTSDDPRGLRLVREGLAAVGPHGIDVAAGEYIYTLDDARALLDAGAVDVLQADATRCGGLSGFLDVAALCEAHHIDLSGHCAPALHRHVACAVPRLRHLEWFHDHARIERLLFDGAPQVSDGNIQPDLSRPGHGLELRLADAQAWQVGEGNLA